MNKDETGKEQQTQYHGGMFYTTRIHEILQMLDTLPIMECGNNTAHRAKIWEQRFQLLNSLFKELYCKMNDQERIEHKNGKEVVRTYFVRARGDYLKQRKVNPFFLELFDEWEMELRALAERKGLIMPDKKEDTGL